MVSFPGVSSVIEYPLNDSGGKLLLRLRGFLHALRLVEMTTKKEHRHLERSREIP